MTLLIILSAVALVGFLNLSSRIKKGDKEEDKEDFERYEEFKRKMKQ